MKKVFSILFKKWYLLIIIAVAIILQCYLQLELPQYMADIQKIVVNNTTAEDITMAILQKGGIMIAFSVGVIILAVVQSYLASKCGAYVGKTLRDEAYKKVISLSLSQYNQFGTATLITRTTNDIEQVKNFITFSIRVFVMSPTYMIIAIVKTLYSKPVLTSVIGIAVPILIAGIIIMILITTPLFKKMQRAVDNVTVVLRENLTGIRVIRAYCMQDKESEKFDIVNRDFTNTIISTSRKISFAEPAVNIIFNVCYMGIFALGFYLISLSSYNLTEPGVALGNEIAEISEVAQYSSRIMMSFMMFAMIFIQIPQSIASANRIKEVLNIKAEEVPTDNEINEEEFQKLDEKGVIEFKNVSFSYPDSDTPCIENISFKTKPGTTTAIIGSTGSGKSTIINLIPRFYDCTEGEILFNGKNIKDIQYKVVRNHVAFVPQTALLFKGTIRENLTFGNDEASDEEITKALQIAQAYNFVNKLPKGLNSEVSQGGKNFSGGQKQRLCIARALVKNSEIFVFDDSFSALDFKTDAKLRYELKQNIKDASVIVVAQRVSSILDADNIIVLNEGKCVGQGTHAELLRTCEIYQDIVRSQLDPEEVEKTIKMYKEANSEGGVL